MAGKPRRKLTRDEIAQVEGWSAIRLPMRQMASLLGMSKTWLEHMAKKDNAVRLALDVGRAKASSTVFGTLFHMATQEKNFQALKFWIETQEETFNPTRLQRVELSGPGGAPIESHNMSKEELKARVMALRKANDLTDDE